jgi:transcriptional regulator with XRE-family HTH domain
MGSKIGRKSSSPYTGTWLDQVMAAQGRRWTWLARATRYSRVYLWQVRAGKRAISAEFVRRVCQALATSEQDLFYIEESDQRRVRPRRRSA